MDTTVKVEKANDPVQLATRIRREPRFLNESPLKSEVVYSKRDQSAKGPREVDEEVLIEARIGGRAGEIRAVELVVDRRIVVGELARINVGFVRIARI